MLSKTIANMKEVLVILALCALVIFKITKVKLGLVILFVCLAFTIGFLFSYGLHYRNAYLREEKPRPSEKLFKERLPGLEKILKEEKVLASALDEIYKTNPNIQLMEAYEGLILKLGGRKGIKSITEKHDLSFEEFLVLILYYKDWFRH